VLVNREELLQQAIASLRQTQPHLKVEAEANTMHADVQGADVVVASVASLGRAASESRRERFRPEDFKLVVIDEAHHTPAAVYQRILQHLNVVGPACVDSDRPATVAAGDAAGEEASRGHSPLVLGCTATMLRHDGVALDFFEVIVFQRQLSDLVEAGYLVRPRPERVSMCTPDLAQVKVRNGDFILSALSAALNTPQHNAMVVEQWRRFAHNAGRKSSLVFCVDVSHMEALTAAFREHGVDARGICGKTPAKQRAQTLVDFSAGRVPVLLNVAVLTEGTDLPCIDCIVFARPTQSQGLFQQMLGRGLRLHPGKEDCLCLDPVGNFDRLELEGEPTLMGMSMAEAEALAERRQVADAAKEEAAAQALMVSALQEGTLDQIVDGGEDVAEDDPEARRLATRVMQKALQSYEMVGGWGKGVETHCMVNGHVKALHRCYECFGGIAQLTSAQIIYSCALIFRRWRQSRCKYPSRRVCRFT
jgi:ATP-dependent helicase IRC3